MRFESGTPPTASNNLLILAFSNPVHFPIPTHRLFLL
jgi:hypothetical protein